MKYTAPLNATHDNDHYVDANPALGIEGSIVSAAAIESAMREVVNTITAAGLTPSANDMTQLTQAVKRLSANTAGENTIPTYYAGEFKDFFEQTPPAGWTERDGHVLTNADVNFPALWLELQKPENTWKLKTEAQWNALSTTAGGVGGVPYFVLDTDAKTIKLPDTRTDFFRDANSNVGDWQNDAIRDIVGTFRLYGWQTKFDSGAFSSIDGTGHKSLPSGGTSIYDRRYTFTAEGSIGSDHIATEIRPRNIAMLGCVCIDPAKAQRNEATTTTPGAVYLGSGADDQRTNAVPNVTMAAGLGMPSGREISISVQASGEIYTAPAHGYFIVSGNTKSTNNVVQFLDIIDNDTNMQSRMLSPVSGTYGLFVSIPVGANDSVIIRYGDLANLAVNFVYAQGAY